MSFIKNALSREVTEISGLIIYDTSFIKKLDNK